MRWTLLALAWCAGAAFAFALGDALYSTTLPELRPWHTVSLDGEFDASRAVPGYDFDAYRADEARLFDAVERLRGERFDPSLDTAVSRFAPGRGPYAARVEGDWNRSARLDAPNPRGVALLVHGLSDSPYSMRSLALALRDAGVTVYLLRLPGHGTIPSGLDTADWPDWLAAVELTVRQIRRDHPSLPFWYAGFSTGATLGLKLCATAVRSGRTELLPRRLFLFSPALGVTRFAALANVQRLVSRWGVAPKARWANVGPEIDPHKYESFAKNAGAQISALIGSLYQDLRELERAGAIARLPPVSGFQSVVDATVVTTDLATRFYALLHGGTSELVLYDVNRRTGATALLASPPDAVVDAFERAPRRGYRLVVLGNPDGARTLTELTWEPGAAEPVSRPLSLAWPEDVVSLSHLALPVHPDDPIWGLRHGPSTDGLPSLGALALRGERGVLAIAAADQLRLRANPFFDDLLARVLARIDADAPARRP